MRGGVLSVNGLELRLAGLVLLFISVYMGFLMCYARLTTDDAPLLCADCQ